MEFLKFLRRPGWEHAKREKRQAVLTTIDDPATLAHIARTATYPDVRAEAARKITDEAILAALAAHDSAWFVREAAAARIIDQSVLAKVATEDLHESVRLAAAKRLKDRSLQERIAQTDPAKGVRLGLLESVNISQHIRADLAVHDAEDEVKQEAVKKVFIQSLLAEVAKTGEVEFWEALDRIRDPTLLADVAMNGKNEWVRARALERVSDQGVLARAAMKDPAVRVRRIAINKMTDESVLADLIWKDPHHELRLGALRKTTDRATLMSVAVNHEDESLRETALERLYGQDGRLAVERGMGERTTAEWDRRNRKGGEREWFEDSRKCEFCRWLTNWWLAAPAPEDRPGRYAVICIGCESADATRSDGTSATCSCVHHGAGSPWMTCAGCGKEHRHSYPIWPSKRR